MIGSATVADKCVRLRCFCNSRLRSGVAIELDAGAASGSNKIVSVQHVGTDWTSGQSYSELDLRALASVRRAQKPCHNGTVLPPAWCAEMAVYWKIALNLGGLFDLVFFAYRYVRSVWDPKSATAFFSLPETTLALAACGAAFLLMLNWRLIQGMRPSVQFAKLAPEAELILSELWESIQMHRRRANRRREELPELVTSPPMKARLAALSGNLRDKDVLFPPEGIDGDLVDPWVERLPELISLMKNRNLGIARNKWGSRSRWAWLTVIRKAI